MQGRLNPAKGYFRGFWSRRFLFRTFVTSSDFGIAAMKTHTVTVCSSRPPPGKWFGTRVLQKFVTASGNSLSDRRNSFNKSLVPCLVRWTIQHLSDLFEQNSEILRGNTRGFQSNRVWWVRSMGKFAISSVCLLMFFAFTFYFCWSFLKYTVIRAVHWTIVSFLWLLTLECP